MLLTLSPPAKSEFKFKTPHDYSPPLPLSTLRSSPTTAGDPLRPLPGSASRTMGTPHRGLPPPAAMTLPDPSRGPSGSQQLPSSFGQMPAPPSQWQGAEESMRNWLMAKAEEEKRRQEEERTRQETLKLEQRKIEQTMLRDSMSGGVPPHLVPMIFAGIGGGNLANISIDWLQQYAAQLQAAQQQQVIVQAQSSPDSRRDQRMIGQPQPSVYSIGPQVSQQVAAAPVVLQVQPLAPPPQHAGAFSASSYSVGTMSPTSRARALQPPGQVGAPTSAPRPPPPHSQLPRLTTNDMHIQQPPSAPAVHSLQHSQSAHQQEHTASSPSIYFHHWVPPSSQAGSSSNPPATPSVKAKITHSSHLSGSHEFDSDYTSSPKKRKAQGAHQPAPQPTTQYTSPSFSQVSSSTSTPGRRGHARTRSDASTRGYDPGARPRSYHEPASGRAESVGRSERSSAEQHYQQQQQQRIDEERGGGDERGSGSARNPDPPTQRETRYSHFSHFSAGPDRNPAPGSPKREPR